MRKNWFLSVSVAVAMVGIVLSVLASAGCKRKERTVRPGEMGAKGPGDPAAEAIGEDSEDAKKEADLKDKLAQFAPTKIDFDENLLGENERKVVKKLVEAADVMDHLFLIQVDPDNPRISEELSADPALQYEAAYFDIMYGIWDRTDNYRPFYTDRERPPGVGYYPTDLTKEELNNYIKANPGDEEAFKSYFTVIRRAEGSNGLKAVPYSEYYKEHLDKAAELLREAASLTKDKRLARYLNLRAEAFSTNNYRVSDMAWMDLGDGVLEVVVGPYEVYEDRLFGYKAAFQAFICVRDPVYSKRLQEIAKYRDDLERALPIPDEHKNFKRGDTMPINVVEEIYASGDTRAGVQTLAFVLPNDEVVRQKKGYKIVMLKNIAEAKFNQILMPIAERLLEQDVLEKVSFDAFFMNTLMHEAAHGQGPGTITVERNGKKVQTTVNNELKDIYSVIEEAKADMAGLYLTEVMIEKGVLPKALSRSVFASYLAGFFRSVRFGVSGSHGQANLIAFNFIREKGAITYDEKTKKFGLDFAKIRDAVRELTTAVLMLQAEGDYEGSKRFVEKYGEMAPEMTEALGRLGGIPVDIKPEFTVLEKMKSW